MKQNEEHPRAEVDVEKLAQELKWEKELRVLCAKQCDHYKKIILDVCAERDELKALQQRAEVKETIMFDAEKPYIKLEVKEESWDEEVLLRYSKEFSLDKNEVVILLHFTKWLQENYHSPKPKNK